MFYFDNTEMAQSRITQMSIQNHDCERWIGSLNADSRGTEAVDDSWMGVSPTGAAATSGGGVCSKRVADGPSHEDGPSKRRKAVRDMTEGLLNSISVRAAHAINMALVPGAEPLLSGQSNLVLPRFSQSSKSPHYDLPSESRSARRGEKRVLFPVTGGASLTRGLAGAVDLTEPLFEDSSRYSDSFQFGNCMLQDSVGVGVNTAAAESVSNPVFDINNNFVDPNPWDRFPCDFAVCNPKNKYEDLVDFINCADSHDFSCHESVIEQLGTDLLKREPKLCPTSAFQLFSFKVLPLLRIPDEEAIDAVKSSWDQLPTTEKYAFEMQTFALTDSYKNELITYVDTMPEATRKMYLRLRRRRHAEFFGYDVYKGYGGEVANDSSSGHSKLSTRKNNRDSNNDCNNNGCVVSERNGHSERRSTSFNNSGHFYFPQNFETSFSAARNSTENFHDEPFNTSFEHHADKRNQASTTLSNPATSLSSASWHTDEEPYALEEWSFVEEDVTQEFDSDSDCDSSETSTVTSTVTSVVMRPVRN